MRKWTITTKLMMFVKKDCFLIAKNGTNSHFVIVLFFWDKPELDENVTKKKKKMNQSTGGSEYSEQGQSTLDHDRWTKRVGVNWTACEWMNEETRSGRWVWKAMMMMIMMDWWWWQTGRSGQRVRLHNHDSPLPRSRQQTTKWSRSRALQSERSCFLLHHKPRFLLHMLSQFRIVKCIRFHTMTMNFGQSGMIIRVRPRVTLHQMLSMTIRKKKSKSNSWSRSFKCEN